LKLSKEFYIGIFTLIALGLMVLGFNYLLGKNLFAANKEYTVYYAHAKDLSTSSPVTYRGIKVVINLK